ncbi:amidase [Planotetraspora thailandica]|uniref:Amidase n=1 Tax=Planotetraspora thailandica TaxID=487172 RepID=A0A8J3V218_9ACTN|nr:amidase [Planotetraspora thailandica]GII56289.1 amidase [Planotetraspora thailandica]
MQFHEYARYDAVGLRDLIRAGEVTADEVERVARQALAVTDAKLNGLALPVFSPALDHADDGPFTGVPFLIKDHGPVAKEVPFFLGSRSLPGIVPQHDSDLMARFRAAGLVTLGLTTVPEMAISFSTESLKYGPTRNPWDLDRGVGGSSGGAAALVAAGAVPVAHGSDGAGSIRVPASCCGLVGLKPSRGRVPCGPDQGEPMLGMASEFALTRTVRDAAHLLDAVQGPGVGDKYTAPPPRGRYADDVGADPGSLRVAVTTQAWSGAVVDGEAATAAVQAGRVLEQMGHTIADASPIIDWDAVMRCAVAEAVALASPLLMAPRQPDPARLEAVSRQLLRVAADYSALDMMAAFGAQNRLTRSVGAFFTEYDLLITPTLGRLPAPHGTLRYDDPSHTVTSWLQSIFDYGPFTMVFNISGQPAISLPLGRSEGGLPIGVQIIASYGREDVLFRIAAQLELAMPWKERSPRFSLAGGTPVPGCSP